MPRIDISFRNDWELDFRDPTKDSDCLFWQKPMNAIFSCHWEEKKTTMTDEFKVFSDDSKFVSQNPTD